MPDLLGWAGLTAIAFLLGMATQALRESLRPVGNGPDRPEDDGYVAAIEEERG